jgi:hypothetical protein
MSFTPFDVPPKTESWVGRMIALEFILANDQVELGPI